MDEIIIPKLAELKPTDNEIIAFYMVPRNGGFQLRKVIIEEDVVLSDENYDDPDAWDQIISILENEMSKKFK